MKSPRAASAAAAATLLLLVIIGLIAVPRAGRDRQKPAPAARREAGRGALSRTNRQTSSRSVQIAAWRRAFSFHPAADGIPPSEDFAVRLESRVLDTSISSARGWTTRGSAPAGLPGDQIVSSRGVRPYIVQFSGAILESWKTAVLDAGGILRGYLPNNAYLVELDSPSLARVATLEPVQWIGEYQPEYKIQPFLGYLAGKLASSPDRTVADQSGTNFIDVSLRTFDPRDVAEIGAALSRAGGTVIATAGGPRWGLVRANISPDSVAGLSRYAAVQWIEEYVPPVLNNDSAARGNHLNVTNVWAARGLTGYKQIIGHADTGLDIGSTNGIHPDFAGRVKVAIALGRPGDWSDTEGHGTHTAGSILGDGSASTGRFSGIARGAQLVHQSVMDSGGGLGGLPAYLGDLFLQAYTNGARIHSDSWGSSVYGLYDADAAAVDEFMWDHPDMLVVFSAGNDGSDGNANGVVDLDSIGAPATAKNLLTVGAAENDRAAGSGGYSALTWGAAWPSDYSANPVRDDFISQSADGVYQGMAAFSSRGPTDDGRVKPDIVAPGTDVISCRSRAPGAGVGWGAHPNPGYAFSGGTSMSTPLMAGAAALVRQYLMERRGLTNPSAALMKAVLLNGARSLTPGQYGTGSTREVPGAPRPNNVEGWGQANIEDTLFPASPRKLMVCDTNALATGGTNTYEIYIGSTNRLSVTLAYSDFPGTAGAGKKLVNDLDLFLSGPGGTSWYPNGRASADRTNNIEGIDVAAPVTGVYTVRVTGFTVPESPQRYALVVSGGWEPIAHTPLLNTTNTVDAQRVDAILTALNAADTNTFRLLWNTSGSGPFQTNQLAWVTGHVWRALIPAQPTNTTVHYYLQMEAEGQTWRLPTNAPSSLYRFRVTAPVTLVVTGSPGEFGTAVPAYGPSVYAVSSAVAASVSPFTAPAAGLRYACTGWVGSGSVPPSGASNSLSFYIEADSILNWQWSVQYALFQTSTVAGVVNTTTWWLAGTTGLTVTAPTAASLGGTNYQFAQWTVNGARWPDATNPAVNPASGLAMTTSRPAVAVYLRADLDLDGDDIPDWWELYYFGSTAAWRDDDADADGFTNLQEFRDRTDPRNAASVPARPVIAHTPLADPQARPAPFAISAVVTDNYLVAGATLHWIRNGDAPQSAAMTPTGSTNEYAAAIPAPGVDGDHFEYRIEAQDAAGWIATNGPHAFDVKLASIVLSPTNLEHTFVMANAQTTRVLTVSNTGSGTLAWTSLVESVGYIENDAIGEGAWTHGGSNDLWHISTNRFFSANRAWYAGSDASAQYVNGMNAWLMSGPVTLVSGARLSFRYWAATELKDSAHAYDGGIVEVSTNDGASFAPIAPTGGYPFRIVGGAGSPFTNDTPCIAGTGGWQQAVFDLSAFAGRDVRIRFRFGSDSSKTAEGWFVDDIEVTPNLGETDWLMVPMSGFVDGGSASNLWLTFNFFADLMPGDVRAATITFFANDINAPTSRIPVSIIVLGTNTDIDGDGMLDPWELAHGLDAADAADAALDPDGDGYLNTQEFIALTEPFNSNSYLRITGLARSGALYVTFPASAERRYDVSFSTNLMQPQWTSLVTGVPGSNGIMWISDTNRAGSRAYRMDVYAP